MEKIVFFTMNDFLKEGGGTIRMLGIINELAKIHPNIILISNIKDKTKVHPNVEHISIGLEFSRQDKRKFQFILGAFDYKKLNKSYPKALERFKTIFSNIEDCGRIFFFEYLDNSIGYWLKKNEYIKGYINDIHGIASNEFDFQAKKTKSLKNKFFFRIKENISNKLDRKVFENADGIIYASDAMNEYFKKRYPILKAKTNYHLPYLLNYQNIKPADSELIFKLKNDFKIKDSDFVFLFAGAYKETGGIQDLIIAFNKIAEQYNFVKLLLIGDGPTYAECQKLIKTQKHFDRIFLLGRQPYDYLSSFQEISDVLVCPDRQNLFSDLIVHVKYLDALVSGKLVINGAFKSVMEINNKKQLSLLFKPSDINDLATKMENAVENYHLLMGNFSSSKTYTLENLSYKNYISNLLIVN